METVIALILPFMLGLLGLSIVLQLLWTWSLSAIAAKTEQSELMQVLAWIPILQIAPMIVAGGGSVGHFLLGALGLILGVGALATVSAVLGSTLGMLISGLSIGVATLLCIVYFGRLAWNTALNRDLSGWVGLLVFVPFANLIAYPYLAFHDGWIAPHKLGLVIGLVLTFGSAAPTYQTIRMLQEGGELSTQLALLASDELEIEGLEASLEQQLQQQLASELARQLGEEGRPTFELVLGEDAHSDAPSSDGYTGAEPRASERGTGQRSKKNRNAQVGDRDARASIRALLALKSRFEALEQRTQPNRLQQPGERARAREGLHSIRSELEAHRDMLDRPTFDELARHLGEIEARIEESSQSQTAARRAIAGSPGPAAIPAYSEQSLPPTRPIRIQPADECPTGTELRSEKGDQGEEEWCQQLAEFGGLRHGWYARYAADGRPESLGEYDNGLRVGVWTRFHPSGEVRAQAEFAKGLQHGWLLSFDESGERTKAIRFEQGAPAR
jgi:hypothetical protein